MYVAKKVMTRVMEMYHSVSILLQASEIGKCLMVEKYYMHILSISDYNTPVQPYLNVM